MINIYLKTHVRGCFMLLLSLLLITQYTNVAAQTVGVKGKVTDELGEGMPGVNIVIKGTSTGTATDATGSYTVSVPSDAVLVFSYIGYATEEITVGGQSAIDVSLIPDVQTMDEIVVVGYGTQKRHSVTGAVSQVEGEELLKAPIGDLTNVLGGRVPGIISLQQSGQPGEDGSSLLVRGQAAKYIVDGIERDISEIDPNAIQTVSVLKDASSAAVYGLDASSVIIVTTKRGTEGPSKISATANYGISSNAVMMDLLDGPQYAYWYNKARQMDGDAPVFTQDHIDLMLNNDPTDGWGNTDWYEETFGVGKNQSFNINATGGTEKIKYFVSAGNYHQEGNVKGFDYNRLNLRSNIDAVIANNLDLRFDIAGRIEDKNRPGFGASPADWNNIPLQAMRAHPYVPKEINGIPVSTRTASSPVNPLAASELSGYRNEKTHILQTNLALNYNTPFIEGLSAKFMAAYDVSYHNSKAFSTPYYTYVAPNGGFPSPDQIEVSYTNDSRGTDASLNEGLSHWSKLTTNTSINYTNQFGLHSISAMALLETIRQTGNSFGAYGFGFDIYELDELNYAGLEEKSSVSGSSYEEAKAGVVGRINYEYDSKYLAEVSMRYDGSHVFGGMIEGKRWALFPAGSLGWRISEEDWFGNKFDFVDELKLRGGIGLTGATGGVQPYAFLSTLAYLTNPAVIIGGQPQNGLITSKPGNENLTWAKALQYNAGFDAFLFNGALNIEFDVFYKYVYDILAPVSGAYPDSYGGYVFSHANVNKQDHKGFEIVLSHGRSVGDFTYNVTFNGSYTKRRWLKYEDSPNTPDWLKLTGKEVGSRVGFIAEGLFQSEEEIANSPLIVGKPVRVGDIKYRDMNGDGVISYEQDRGYFGLSAYPKFVGGFSFDGEYKGFDMSFLFQGALGRDVALTGVYSSGVMDNTSMTRPFYHGGNSPVYLVENSWTEENTSAEFPRLYLESSSSNNAYSSTFWYRSGDYLRLKSLQFGYSFPQLKGSFINNLRVYVEGQNLFTLSELTKYNIDPELPGVSNGYYPQQQIFSVGVNLTL